MGFCKNRLSCLPADTEIFVMDCLVGLAGVHRFLYAGNGLHTLFRFLHSGAGGCHSGIDFLQGFV